MGGIDIEHLTRDFGSGRGVFDITFSVAPGEVFGFLGPNGAGKTTTIRHLLGFLRARAGSVAIDGKNPWANASVLDDVGYVPGELALLDMKAGAYLRFLERYRSRTAERKDELVALFELPLDLPIRKMSKGMKQKVGIVAAFMFSPRILILDEPTSGLDPLMQNRFVDLVEEEKRRGCAILLSSHIFDEVQRTADRIGIIRAGHMVAVDTAAALRERHMRHYTVTLASPEEAAAFSQDFGGSSEGCTATVSASQNLERIFLDYYKEQR